VEANEKSEKTARDIINILAENECTVIESEDILRYVGFFIKDKTVVSTAAGKLFETEKTSSF
jgi:hypothetical protein